MDESRYATLSLIGQRLKDTRKAMGFTQEQAAEIGNTTQQTISKAEMGEHYLPVDIAYRLCCAYGISVEYLMTGVLSDTDTEHLDTRAQYLSEEQLSHYKSMIDYYFLSHGIAKTETVEDSR